MKFRVGDTVITKNSRRIAKVVETGEVCSTIKFLDNEYPCRMINDVLELVDAPKTIEVSRVIEMLDEYIGGDAWHTHSDSVLRHLSVEYGILEDLKPNKKDVVVRATMSEAELEELSELLDSGGYNCSIESKDV